MSLALDIGGANLKAADGRGFGLSRFFPLWREPDRLTEALKELIAASPACERAVVTMTGELADCYATKADGVRAIVAALESALAGRELRIYLTDGTLVPADVARERPLLAAASNWHALASFAGRYAAEDAGLLVDIGSTTCDIIPLAAGRPAALGRTDPERLASGELVYTGVERSPVCAVSRSLPWRGQLCGVAQELFATTRDAYLVLGELPEEPDCTHTADGRPATRDAAHDRLARVICSDRTMFDAADAQAAARTIADDQLALVIAAVERVIARQAAAPRTIVVSGEGEFLARRMAAKLLPQATIVSLTETLGPVLSRVAPAHALAVLAREQG